MIVTLSILCVCGFFKKQIHDFFSNIKTNSPQRIFDGLIVFFVGILFLSCSLVLGEYGIITKNSELALSTLSGILMIGGVVLLLKKNVWLHKIPADLSDGIRSMFSNAPYSSTRYKKIEEEEEKKMKEFLANRKEFGDYF